LLLLYTCRLKQMRMAAKSTEMELVKQVLNLYNEGKSIKWIVRITGVSRNTVKEYINRDVFAQTRVARNLTADFYNELAAFEIKCSIDKRHNATKF
jgi:DNA invertase Pin-like site-specific DNA recombinase